MKGDLIKESLLENIISDLNMNINGSHFILPWI